MPHIPFIDAGDAATRLGITRASLYAYASRGQVEARPDPADPRRSLYRADDIDRLARNKARGRKPEKIAESTLDWGLPALSSRLTLIEGGRLYYRGMDAVELAANATLEDVARHLWGCGADDPFLAEAPAMPASSPELGAGSVDPYPLDRCLQLLSLVGTGSRMLWMRDPRHVWPDAVSLLRILTASITGRIPSAKPIDAQLAQSWGVRKPEARIIRAALILCADHELNASSFAVRVVASTGASLAACLIGGLATLSGPLHGGTTSLVEILFDEAESSGDAARVVEERLRRGDRLPGFGHQLYPQGDPRARALLALLAPEARRDALLAAMAGIGGREPNVDFALVSMRRALRLPRGAAFSLFAIGRAVGWVAHALEQRLEGKLIRPRARYVGEPPHDGRRNSRAASTDTPMMSPPAVAQPKR